ncbi:MAG: 50S ribosomal protein L9 [Acidimicrobiales bacterium]
MTRLVLRQDMGGLGLRGDIIEVADGYARNYLVPTGLAFPATKGVLDQAAAMRSARDLRDSRDRESAEAVARRLVPFVVQVQANAGAEGRLFGSVTASDIATAVSEQAGVDLDRRKLHMQEPIKSIGRHEVPVKLHPEVEFRVTVEVVPA